MSKNSENRPVAGHSNRLAGYAYFAMAYQPIPLRILQ